MDKLKGCAIGEREIIRIFKMISFDVLPISNAQQFNEELKKKLESEAYNLIIVTETFITQINEVNKSLISEKKPIIMSIPTNYGSKEIAVNTLSTMIRKAVGVDLISIGGENNNEWRKNSKHFWPTCNC